MFEITTLIFIAVLVVLCIGLLFFNAELSFKLRNQKTYNEYYKGQLERHKEALKKAMANDYRDPKTGKYVSRKEYMAAYSDLL